MFAITRKKIGLGLLLLATGLVALFLPAMAIGRPILAPATGTNPLGLVCTEEAGDTTPTFDLETNTGYITLPDGNSVFMWSYNLAGQPFQVPGPILCVNQGDVVTVNLTNSNINEPVSIMFPGQTGVTASMISGSGVSGPLALAANNGETVQYQFTASEPGTYLYQSGTAPHKQVQMGLYGAVIVRPALNGSGRVFAYNDPTTRYAPDREFLLLMHEIDSDLHQAVELGRTFDVTKRHDHYWTINGRSLPDTLLDNFVPWMPSQPYGALVQVEADARLPALVRYANAGTVNHPFHPHGDHLKVIGQDGRFLGDAAIDAFAKTIGGGQSFDLLFTWDNVEGWTPGPNGPIPLQMPGLQNLVFKDGVTFYSGNPNLGQQGELPTGTTSFNQCGEFYFPWHSHALNEFQNFDEGFGGLATLVRVDPPGGCP